MSPRYDFRCAAGHVTEQRQPREIGAIDCDCGLTAQRLISSGVGSIGFAARPTREAPIPLTRALDAQSDILYHAEKQGHTAPDFWGIAKERVRRGDVKAIE